MDARWLSEAHFGLPLLDDQGPGGGVVAGLTGRLDHGAGATFLNIPSLTLTEEGLGGRNPSVKKDHS